MAHLSLKGSNEAKDSVTGKYGCLELNIGHTQTSQLNTLVMSSTKWVRVMSYHIISHPILSVLLSSAVVLTISMDQITSQHVPTSNSFCTAPLLTLTKI